MEKTDFTCGLEAALALISGKWKLLILYHLAHGTKRYGALKRCVGGVTDKMLGQHLKEMQADGLILRVDFQEIPPHVEYSLAPLGVSLARTLAPICAWGEENAMLIQDLVQRRVS
jgi:DNA-binding HxlR family transcriptional regulator